MATETARFVVTRTWKGNGKLLSHSITLEIQPLYVVQYAVLLYTFATQ